MMTHSFETREITLNTLSLHPDNVRAQSNKTYSDAQIAPMAANIRACGLLQPLLVAPLAEGGWGVLAGCRRFAALKLLAADKSTKGFPPKMPVACRVAASTVKEALRLGAIHPHIRQAHREGKLDVEALKAFDAHPDPNVQLAAFEALTAATSYGRLQSWKVRCHFQSRAMVRAGDALGALVLADYRAANGPITADLIEEDSILDDSVPIETVLRRLLSD